MTQPWPVQITALTPAACGAARWRNGGASWVTIIVKATFNFVHGQLATLATPREILREDRYRERTGSLEEASETAPYLPSAGVLLTGHAYAPGGRSVPTAAARLAIVRERPLLDKTVHIFGDRVPGASRAQPFQKMPLVYERAYGGAAMPENPVGVGAAGAAGQPNVLDPANPQRPAGLGPISRDWPARKRLLGSGDAGGLLAVDPVIPEGFDWRYFHAAPSDQQIERLSGDEWIVLDGLHPSLPRVQTRLPSAFGRARWHLVTSSGVGPLQSIDLAADTLVIDADRLICSVVWRGRLALARPELAGCVRVFAGVELAGSPIPWPRAPEALSGTGEVDLRHVLSAIVPFKGAKPAPSPLASTGGMNGVRVGPALPFAPFDPSRPALLAEPQSTARPTISRGSSPLEATADADMQQALRAILPFLGTPQARATAGTPAPVPISASDPSALLPDLPHASPAYPPPLVQAPPAYVSPPIQQPLPVMEPPRTEIAPPNPCEPAPLPAPELATPAALPLISYPIERCAAIAGSIARRKVEKTVILQAHDLTPEVWARLDSHWREAIQQESQRGNMTLLRAHDAAYVGQIEAERGPITIDQYARLTTAMDNGIDSDTLTELELPRGALLPVQRSWVEKMSRNKELAEHVRKAVERAT